MTAAMLQASRRTGTGEGKELGDCGDHQARRRRMKLRGTLGCFVSLLFNAEGGRIEQRQMAEVMTDLEGSVIEDGTIATARQL